MFIASLPTAAPSSPPFPAPGGPSTSLTGDVAAGSAPLPPLDASGFDALVQGTQTNGKIGGAKPAASDSYSKSQSPLWPDSAPGSDFVQALAASLNIQIPQPLAPPAIPPSDAGPAGAGLPKSTALAFVVPFAPNLATPKPGLIADPEPSAQTEAPAPARDESPSTAAPGVVGLFTPNLATAKPGLLADQAPPAQTDASAPGSPSSPAIARQRAPANPAAIAASFQSPRPASRVNAAAASAVLGTASIPNHPSAPAPTDAAAAPTGPLSSSGLDLAINEGLSPILKDPSPSLKPAPRVVSAQAPAARASTPQTPAVAAADGVPQTAAARPAPAVDQAPALAPPTLLAATAAPDNAPGLIQAPAQPIGQPQGQLRPSATSGSNRALAVSVKTSLSGSSQPGAPATASVSPDQVLALAGTGSQGPPKDQGGDKAPGGQALPVDDAPISTAAPATDGSAIAGSIQAQAAAPQPALAKVDARTVSQLSAQIVQSVKGNKSSFDLTLHPEGLGDVQVKVSVDRTGAVTASMSFNNPQTGAELAGRAGELRDALAQAGFTVADNGLSFNLGGHGQSGADQGAWAEASQLNAGRAFLAARDNSEDLLAAVSQAAVRLQRPSAAGLDILI